VFLLVNLQLAAHLAHASLLAASKSVDDDRRPAAKVNAIKTSPSTAAAARLNAPQ